jgi:hypothetical protein
MGRISAEMELRRSKTQARAWYKGHTLGLERKLHGEYGMPVKTERFRVEEQGKTSYEFEMQTSYEFEMHKGLLIDETVMVSSFVELTKIFEGTFVNPRSCLVTIWQFV